MNIWYNLINALPFEWTHYNFMKNALLAVLLVTPIFGLLGTMVVNNKMAFFSDALGHSALTGAGLGVVLGIANPDIAMIIFAVIFAVGIVIVKYKQKAAMDTTIGVFSATAVALGIVLLSKGGFNKYSNLLVGDILSISKTEIYMLLILLVAVLIIWRIMYNSLFLSSLGGTLAKSRGINTLMIEIVFTALIALVVTFSIKWIGLLIITSLFILPASAARLISKNMRQYKFITIIISMFCGIVGLITSYYINSPAGATIVLFCSAIYGVLLILPKK